MNLFRGQHMKEKVYTTHTCYVCGNAFLDVDITNAMEKAVVSRACYTCRELYYTNRKSNNIEDSLRPKRRRCSDNS